MNVICAFGMRTLPIFSSYVALERKVSDGCRMSAIFGSNAPVFETQIFTAFISMV